MGISLFIQGAGNRLTSRAGQVVLLIARGHANKQIADDLDISIKTVEKHRQQVMNKLNIHDVAGLTRYVCSGAASQQMLPFPALTKPDKNRA